MSETHWKTMMDNTYLGVCDFELGKYVNLKIKQVVKETIPPKNDERPVIYFTNCKKPLVCNATNGKTIQRLLKTPIIEKWAGHTITLYADMSVRSPGQKKGDVPDGGVRVFNQLPPQTEAPKKLICKECGNEVKSVVVDGKEYSPAGIFKSSNGLCYDCYLKSKKSVDK